MKQLCDAHGIDADRQPPAHALPDAVYDCGACRDSGFVVVPDGGAGEARQCKCTRPENSNKVLRALMGSAGMKTGEIDAAFSPWDPDVSPPPVWAREWLAWAMTGCHDEQPVSLPERMLNPRLLTMLGLTGRGKTKTAGVLMRLYISNGGRGGLWVRIPDEDGFDLVQRQRKEDGFSTLEGDITNAPFVVLDELGSSYRGKNQTIAETANEWIHRRERRGGLTAITTNAESLGDLQAGRLESRLASGLYRLMEGPDYRDRP